MARTQAKDKTRSQATSLSHGFTQAATHGAWLTYAYTGSGSGWTPRMPATYLDPRRLAAGSTWSVDEKVNGLCYVRANQRET